MTEDHLTYEQTSILTRILQDTSLHEREDYVVGVSFKGMGHTYVKGFKWQMSPADVLELQENIQELDFDEGVEALTRLDRSGEKFGKSSVSYIGQRFAGNPAIFAHYFGMIYGLNEGETLGEILRDRYEGNVADQGFCDPRVIDQTEINLAWISGAIFGPMASEKLKASRDEILRCMRYAEPYSFHTSNSFLFLSGYREKAAEQEVKREDPMYKLFEDTLFDVLRKDTFVTLDEE